MPRSVLPILKFFVIGAIEAVWTFPFGGIWKTRGFLSLAFENELIDGIQYYLRKQEKLDVATPIYLMVTLLEGYRMVMDNLGNNSAPFNKDSFFIPEIMVDKYEVDISKLLKAVLDIIWNSVGVECSIYYDESGNRVASNKRPFYF